MPHVVRDHNGAAILSRLAGRDPSPGACGAALCLRGRGVPDPALVPTGSRPYPKPPSGKICVKVINHLGDKVQKVFRV